MLSRTAKFVAAASLAGVLGLGATTGAFASPSASPHLTPANTAVKGKLKTGTTLTATGVIDGASITVTCTKMSLAGTTPAAGVTTPPPSPCPLLTGVLRCRRPGIETEGAEPCWCTCWR